MVGAVSFFPIYIYLFYMQGVFSTHKPSDRVGGFVGTCCRGVKRGWLISWFIYPPHPFKTRTEKSTSQLTYYDNQSKPFSEQKRWPRWWYAGPPGLENDHITLRSIDFYLKKKVAEKTKEFQSNTWKEITQSRQTQVNLQLRMQLKEVKTLLELFSSWVLENVLRASRELCFYQCILCFVTSRQHRYTLQFPDCNSPNVNLRETQERKVQ